MSTFDHNLGNVFGPKGINDSHRSDKSTSDEAFLKELGKFLDVDTVENVTLGNKLPHETAGISQQEYQEIGDTNSMVNQLMNKLLQ